jgi:hypothetical protein
MSRVADHTASEGGRSSAAERARHRPEIHRHGRRRTEARRPAPTGTVTGAGRHTGGRRGCVVADPTWSCSAFHVPSRHHPADGIVVRRRVDRHKPPPTSSPGKTCRRLGTAEEHVLGRPVASVTPDRLCLGAGPAPVDDHRASRASARRSGPSIGRPPPHRAKCVLRMMSGWPRVVVGRPGFGVTSAAPPQLSPRCLDRASPPVLLGVALKRCDAHRIGGSAISYRSSPSCLILPLETASARARRAPGSDQ